MTNGRELVLGQANGPHRDLAPVQTQRMLPAELLSGLPPEIKVKDVISHDTASHEKIKYGSSTQTHRDILGMRHIRKTISMQIDAEHHTNVRVQTEHNGVQGVMEIKHVTYGVNPFAKAAQPSVLHQLEGQGQLLINFETFLANRKRDGASPQAIRGFIANLAEEAGGYDNLPGSTFINMDVYNKWQAFHEKTRPLALESTASEEKEKRDLPASEVNSSRAEEPTSGSEERKNTWSRETIMKAAALAEADLYPLDRKKGPEDNLITLPDGTQMKQKVMQFKRFKTVLQFRPRQNKEQLERFKSWIDQNHQVTLKKVEDEDYFPLSQLFFNFLSWLQQDASKDNENHPLKAKMKDHSLQAMAENMTDHFHEHRLKERLAFSQLTPVQQEHFGATISIESGTSNPGNISRAWNPKRKPELENPLMTEADFEERLKKWQGSWKSFDYYFKRFPEFIWHGVKKLCSNISEFLKKVGDRLQIKRSEKRKVEEQPQRHHEQGELSEYPIYWNTEDSWETHLKLHKFSPVEKKYFENVVSSSMLDIHRESFPDKNPQSIELSGMRLSGEKFLKALEFWKKSPKPGRYHIERFAEVFTQKTTSFWKSLCKKIAEFFRKVSKSKSKKDFAQKTPEEKLIKEEKSV